MTDNVLNSSSSMRDQEVLGHRLKLKSNNPCYSNRRLTENETSCFCTTNDNKTQQGKMYIHTVYTLRNRIMASFPCCSLQLFTTD